MKYFAVNYDYNPASPEIAKVRPAHREFTGQLFDEGTIVASGPLTDSQGGALIIVCFDDDNTQVSDVIALMDKDPFYQEGCLQGRSFREWTPVKARF
ncbi:hypothetical protein GWO52_06835 [Corynebacterium macginleyi]|uniref:YciI family protein n=1 Tax=Corynebacterium macginleyi TaxID=38290 RepID=UPI00190BAE01|nr:YciI family protein [Corynebacterium macginleyi]MBK4138132.1 hypothetical protein [Corynebacterium macginleyi]